jgi:hypothetical protein
MVSSDRASLVNFTEASFEFFAAARGGVALDLELLATVRARDFQARAVRMLEDYGAGEVVIQVPADFREGVKHGSIARPEVPN